MSTVRMIYEKSKKYNLTKFYYFIIYETSICTEALDYLILTAPVLALMQSNSQLFAHTAELLMGSSKVLPSGCWQYCDIWFLIELVQAASQTL